MTVAVAIDTIRDGGIVVVVDDEDRENEGDLMMAAQCATAEKVAFFLRHTSGVICVALSGERTEPLGLPLMVPDNHEAHRTASTTGSRATASRSLSASRSRRA